MASSVVASGSAVQAASRASNSSLSATMRTPAGTGPMIRSQERSALAKATVTLVVVRSRPRIPTSRLCRLSAVWDRSLGAAL